MVIGKSSPRMHKFVRSQSFLHQVAGLPLGEFEDAEKTDSLLFS